jgi:hypothetical protein
MGYSTNLATHIVIESIERIRVNKTIADPAARPHGLVDLVQDRKSVFNAVFGHELGIFFSRL